MSRTVGPPAKRLLSLLSRGWFSRPIRAAARGVKQPATDRGDGAVARKFPIGVVDDPPRDPRHLRFVTPSETSGHIGPEGVYLSSESQWYPDVEGSLATYDVTIALPDGWTAVSQGTPQSDQGHWIVPTKSETLTVVANRFVVKSRTWTAKSE